MWTGGPIALQESALLVNATLLMLIVVVPVFALLFFFAWRYRAGGKAKYQPEWEHSKMDELVWWAVPLEIILVLAALTWTSTHALDPKRPLEGSKPLVVQVIALPWQWLFIYPELDIATANTLEIPAGVPIQFVITADAPMNSFIIPKLGGQLYAMTGMASTLHLMAAEPGEYEGFSANYSGEGFAGMRFIAHARSQADFDTWVKATGTATSTLSRAGYDLLAQPSTSTPIRTWGGVEPGLFDQVLLKFH